MRIYIVGYYEGNAIQIEGVFSSSEQAYKLINSNIRMYSYWIDATQTRKNTRIALGYIIQVYDTDLPKEKLAEIYYPDIILDFDYIEE